MKMDREDVPENRVIGNAGAADTLERMTLAAAGRWPAKHFETGVCGGGVLWCRVESTALWSSVCCAFFARKLRTHKERSRF